MTISKDNLLKNEYPEVASLYNRDLNERPLEMITCGTSYMAHWTCPHCGEDFVRRVSHMLDYHSPTCPNCSEILCKNPPRTIVKGIKKVSDFPEVLKDWDYIKNSYNPTELAAGHNKSVFWKCHICGAEWTTSPNHRCYGDKNGCPSCADKQRRATWVNTALSKSGSLAELYPEIAKEWDYLKNKDAPDRVLPHSNKGYWWTCPKGHSYKSTVSHRTERGSGCPYCSSKIVLPGFNDLSTLYPELLSWWDYNNNKIAPSDIFPNSNKKYHWICPKGHKFETTACSIVRGRGCPVCAGKKVLCGYNDLASQNPELAAEWHPTKNGTATPETVTQKSNKAFWWKCHICSYEWRAPVNARNVNGCPNCSKKGESIPEYVIMFYLQKAGITCIHKYKPWGVNGKEIDIYLPDFKTGIEYDGVVYHNKERDSAKSKLCKIKGISLIRLREEGLPCLSFPDIQIPVSIDLRERNDAFANLVKPLNCLFECLKTPVPDIDLHRDLKSIIAIYETSKGQKSLAYVNPALAAEWDYTKNKGLTPEQVSASSSLTASWVCPRGHKWDAKIYSRNSNGCGCPYCSNQKVLKGFNDLLSQRPDIAEEWAEDNEYSPDEYVYQSNKKVNFKCKICGTTWVTPISSRTLQGTGCPVCGMKKSAAGRINTYIQKNGSLQEKFPDIAQEWDYGKNSASPSEYTAFSKKSVWWVCKNGHSYKAVIGNRTRGGTDCPICYNSRRQKK